MELLRSLSRRARSSRLLRPAVAVPLLVGGALAAIAEEGGTVAALATALAVCFAVLIRVASALRDAQLLNRALVQRNERLREAEELAGLGSFVWDVESDTLTWSDGLFAIFGLDPAEFEPSHETFASVVHPDDRESVAPTIYGALETGQLRDWSFRVRRGDGTELHVVVHGEVVRDHTGRIVRMLGISQDMTARTLAQTELAEQNDRLRLAEGLAGLGHWRWDIATGAVSWSEGIYRLWGVDADFEPSYDAFMETVVEEDRPTVAAAVDRMVATGEPAGYEFRIRRADGAERTIRAEGALVRDTEGGPSHLLGTVQDVTVARRIEAERERLVSELGAQNEQLVELDRLKDEFVASVSHELRTPLTSIRGYLELVLEGEAGPLTEEQTRFLGVVDRNSERLLRLVGDLLFVAQVEAGSLQLELTKLDLAELARECVQSAGPAADARHVALELHVEPVPPIGGDQARIAQLLDNLTSNALKFTPEGGRVDVTVAPAGDGVLLEVRDTGMGVPEAERERLFGRFYRTSEASRRAIQGTGLGLAISKAIVDAHGGRIAVESAEGVGTTFRVELPAATAAIRAA